MDNTVIIVQKRTPDWRTVASGFETVADAESWCQYHDNLHEGRVQIGSVTVYEDRHPDMLRAAGYLGRLD